MHPFAQIVQTFLENHPEIPRELVLGLEGGDTRRHRQTNSKRRRQQKSRRGTYEETGDSDYDEEEYEETGDSDYDEEENEETETYTGDCKIERRAFAGSCDRLGDGFDVYDRPKEDGTFEKCCFRLFEKGKQDTHRMMILTKKRETLRKRLETFRSLFKSGEYKTTAFRDNKKKKTTRFTKKTLVKKMTSLDAKRKRVEEHILRLQKELGIDKISADGILKIKGAILNASDEGKKRPTMRERLAHISHAVLDAIVGIFNSMREFAGWFRRAMGHWFYVAIVCGILYLWCDNTMHRWCEDDKDKTWWKNLVCGFVDWDTSKWGGAADQSIDVKDYDTWNLFSRFKARLWNYTAWMNADDPIALLFLNNKWVDKSNKYTTCQNWFDVLVCKYILGYTVISTGQASSQLLLGVGTAAVNTGLGFAMGGPAGAAAAATNSALGGVSDYYDMKAKTPSFLETPGLQKLALASAAGTAAVYASTNLYSLENEKKKLETDISKIQEAKREGIEIREDVLKQKEQRLANIGVQINDIEEKQKGYSNIASGVADAYGQQQIMEREQTNALVQGATSVIGTGVNLAAAKYGKNKKLSKAQKLKASQILTGINEAQNFASKTFEANRVHGEAAPLALRKFAFGLQSNKSAQEAAAEAAQEYASKRNKATRMYSNMYGKTATAAAKAALKSAANRFDKGYNIGSPVFYKYEKAVITEIKKKDKKNVYTIEYTKKKKGKKSRKPVENVTEDEIKRRVSDSEKNFLSNQEFMKNPLAWSEDDDDDDEEEMEESTTEESDRCANKNCKHGILKLKDRTGRKCCNPLPLSGGLIQTLRGCVLVA